MPMYHTASRSRRGFAILVAISVLTVLTILIFSLATVSDFTMRNNHRSKQDQQSHNLARTGLDGALQLLRKDTQTLLTSEVRFALGTGSVVIYARPTSPDDDWYESAYFSQRPGDYFLTVRALPGPKGSRFNSIEQLYLVNVQSGNERVVLLKETKLQ